MTFLVFDIGGTSTRVALSDDGETLSASSSFATPAKVETAVDAIATWVEAHATSPVQAASGGVRGTLLEDHEGIERDGILAKWVGVPLRTLLARRLACSVILENDTAMAGLGEALLGAGQGAEIVVYHSIGTGVGGVKIENGTIDRASVGFEPGHQVLDIDRTVLGEDVPPTLENLVSGRAVEQRMKTKPEQIDQDDVIWEELAGYLGQGLRNTILYWSPEMIVLGGSMIVGEPRIPLEAIRRATVAALDGVAECPFITIAKLGDTAGLHGALTMLKH